MSTKGLVIAFLGTACVGAAAAAGFVAVRMNSADRALATVGATNAPADQSTAAASPATPVADPAPPPSVPVAQPASAPASGTSKKIGAPATATRATGQTVSVAPTAQMPPSIVDPPLATSATPPAAATTTADPPPPVPDTPPADPKPIVDELTVKAESVIGVSLDNTVTSAGARVEDRITGRVTRDVTVDGRVAIPSNSRLEGVVTLVERGGKFKDQARIGIRFTTLYLPDNTKVSIQTEQIFRDGEAPGNSATSKVGTGTVLGAILGAVIGGKKGAAVGAAAGAGGGAAAVAAGHTNDATIPSGVPMTVRVTAPVTVTVIRNQDQ